jgi:outer membrane immunogenic protein
LEVGAMRSRIVSLLAAAFSLALIPAASAADMPTKAPVYKAAPMAVLYNWTGFYLGLNAGYAWGSTSTDYSLASVANTTLNPKGFIGGVQAGYNWQIDRLVFGIEGDIDWHSATDSTTFGFPGGLDFTTTNAKQTWDGTIRGRVGFAPDNWLFYLTGGAAFAGFDHSYTEARPSVAGATRTISGATTKTGWAAGGGVEYGMGPWSLGAEYIYMGFGNNTLSTGAQTLGGVAFPADSMSFKDHIQVARLKLNYRFGSR